MPNRRRLLQTLGTVGVLGSVPRFSLSDVSKRSALLPVAHDPSTASKSSWGQHATPLWRGDHPRVVSADAEQVHLLVAPFLRGVQDGSSGLMVWHRTRQDMRFLLRSTPTLLPNHLASVLDDGAALYWLSGLRIMRTDKHNGQTQLWDERGSLNMALSPRRDRLYVFNHDNTRQLLGFPLGQSRVVAEQLVQWPFPASGLAADAHSVWMLATPASLAHATRTTSTGLAAPQGTLSALSRFDLHSRQSRRVLPAPSDTSVHIRAFVPYSTEADEAKGRFSGVYWVQRHTRGYRVQLHHLSLRDGEANIAQATPLPITDLNEQYPLQADAHALYGFADSGGTWQNTWTLKRWPHGGREAQTLAQGHTPPTSLWVGPHGVYWTDLTTLYTVSSGIVI